MKKLLALAMALTLCLGLAACGKGGDPSAAGSAGSTGSAASTSQEDPNTTPGPEPYVISDPKVMPEGGSKDGVTYVAWNAIVEHLFFHPVVAYPSWPLTATARPTASTTGW